MLTRYRDVGKVNISIMISTRQYEGRNRLKLVSPKKGEKMK